MPFRIAKFNLFKARARHWYRYGVLCLFSLIVVLGLAMAAVAQTALTWEDLQPLTTTRENPYSHLSIEQTYDLASLARLRLWVGENQLPPDSLEAREVVRLDTKLQGQNLDVEVLLGYVDEAQAYWQQQSESTNAQWTGETIQLSGYVLPLDWDRAERVTEFLLVPYVGACIHVPPPPPNQIVHIQPDKPLELPGLFTAVEVEGQLRSQPATYDLFQVDGSRPVEVSYAMALHQLTPTDAPPTSMPALGESSEASWWQRLQTRSSATLTQAVSTVDRQRSAGTLLWGLLISFSYGVLHTLGPGHGKAVIVTYFVGQGGSLKRGLTMGIKIAVFHVLSAIGIVLLTTLVLRQSVPNNYQVVQLVSYGAIATIGGWMFWRAIPWRHRPKSAAALSGPNSSAAELRLYPTLTQQVATSTTATRWQAPATADCGCLSCLEPQRASDWLSLAIGSVPCSGALLILLYGAANNLLWTSIMMVMAISVGMAITLAWIGTLALMGRNYAERRADNHLEQQRYQRWQRWLKFAGSACVFSLGIGLFGLTLLAGG